VHTGDSASGCCSPRFSTTDTKPAVLTSQIDDSRLTVQVIAKFHYTDPTRTKSAHIVGDELNSITRTRTRTRHGPDTDKVHARCRVRAKFHYTDPIRTRHGPISAVSTFHRTLLTSYTHTRFLSGANVIRVRTVANSPHLSASLFGEQSFDDIEATTCTRVSIQKYALHAVSSKP